MKIIFNDSNGLLGTEEYSDILETLLPAYEKNSHDVYITKRFDSNPEVSTWKISELTLNNNVATLALEEHKSYTSLAGYADSQSKSTHQIIKQYNLVDVDFGFKTSIFSSSGAIRKNTDYSESRLPGEIHKKRPCIVWKVNGSTVQLIPLTTDSSGIGKSNMIELSEDSFKGMSPHYYEQTSYALLDLLQNVSTSRIYAPTGTGQTVNNKYRSFILCSVDRIAIKEAFAKEHSKSILQEKDKLNIRFDNIQREKNRLFDTNQKLKAALKGHELAETKRQQLIQDLADFFETDPTEEALIQALEGETIN